VRHVASGQAQTLLAFAQHWWAAWGARGRLLPGAVPARASDVMRLVPEV
jgi:dTDP-6-deoxy-L-talose 4-dehydrogenase (NAD+)